jgi:hypothetical protein
MSSTVSVSTCGSFGRFADVGLVAFRLPTLDLADRLELRAVADSSSLDEMSSTTTRPFAPLAGALSAFADFGRGFVGFSGGEGSLESDFLPFGFFPFLEACLGAGSSLLLPPDLLRVEDTEALPPFARFLPDGTLGSSSSIAITSGPGISSVFFLTVFAF